MKRSETYKEFCQPWLSLESAGSPLFLGFYQRWTDIHHHIIKIFENTSFDSDTESQFAQESLHLVQKRQRMISAILQSFQNNHILEELSISNKNAFSKEKFQIWLIQHDGFFTKQLEDLLVDIRKELNATTATKKALAGYAKTTAPACSSSFQTEGFNGFHNKGERL